MLENRSWNRMQGVRLVNGLIEKFRQENGFVEAYWADNEIHNHSLFCFAKIEKSVERGKCSPPAFLAYIFQMPYLCKV